MYLVPWSPRQWSDTSNMFMKTGERADMFPVQDSCIEICRLRELEVEEVSVSLATPRSHPKISLVDIIGENKKTYPNPNPDPKYS